MPGKLREFRPTLLVHQMPTLVRASSRIKDRRELDPFPAVELRFYLPSDDGKLEAQHEDYIEPPTARRVSRYKMIVKIVDANGKDASDFLDDGVTDIRAGTSTWISKAVRVRVPTADPAIIRSATFFGFPQLGVRVIGTFRLLFSLSFDIPEGQSVPVLSAISGPFNVVHAGNYSGVQISTLLAQSLADYGFPARIRKTARGVRRSKAKSEHTQMQRRAPRAFPVASSTADNGWNDGADPNYSDDNDSNSDFASDRCFAESDPHFELNSSSSATTSPPTSISNSTDSVASVSPDHDIAVLHRGRARISAARQDPYPRARAVANALARQAMIHPKLPSSVNTLTLPTANPPPVPTATSPERIAMPQPRHPDPFHLRALTNVTRPQPKRRHAEFDGSHHQYHPRILEERKIKREVDCQRHPQLGALAARHYNSTVTLQASHVQCQTHCHETPTFTWAKLEPVSHGQLQLVVDEFLEKTEGLLPLPEFSAPLSPTIIVAG
ncbi:hypothetical protein C8R43DRAFT_588415 [Mycena crocata]|nr:hypothetical protein C8R43DRAFT_588415 [Mycena crocata]